MLFSARVLSVHLFLRLRDPDGLPAERRNELRSRRRHLGGLLTERANCKNDFPISASAIERRCDPNTREKSHESTAEKRTQQPAADSRLQVAQSSHLLSVRVCVCSCCLSVTCGAGALYSTNSGVRFEHCTFTDIGLQSQSIDQDSDKVLDRLGGAVAATGGEISFDQCSFERVTALPNDMQLSSCADVRTHRQSDRADWMARLCNLISVSRPLRALLLSSTTRWRGFRPSGSVASSLCNSRQCRSFGSSSLTSGQAETGNTNAKAHCHLADATGLLCAHAIVSRVPSCCCSPFPCCFAARALAA